jgi:hypothetical protein
MFDIWLLIVIILHRPSWIACLLSDRLFPHCENGWILNSRSTHRIASSMFGTLPPLMVLQKTQR